MTPLDAAKAAFVDEFRRPWDATVGAADCNARSIEAACLAYVRALSEDAGTVEKVARAICADHGLDWSKQNDFRTSASGIDDEQEAFRETARAALTALASRDEK